jgi:DNA-binding NarL/FixJ family response regulator
VETDERLTLVIVENREISRVAIRSLLRSYPNMEVIGEAADGRRAVEITIEKQPAVVLLDLRLPIMDGIEASRLIQADCPRTGILIFTASDSGDDVFAALAAGAAGYCLKGCTGEQLADAIRTVASGGAYLDRDVALKVLQYVREMDPSKKSSSHKNRYLLSPREIEVLHLLVEGLTNQRIAEQLAVSTETVKKHVTHILQKLAVADRTQAAVKAVRHGYL